MTATFSFSFNGDSRSVQNPSTHSDLFFGHVKIGLYKSSVKDLLSSLGVSRKNGRVGIWRDGVTVSNSGALGGGRVIDGPGEEGVGVHTAVKSSLCFYAHAAQPVSEGESLYTPSRSLDSTCEFEFVSNFKFQ